MRAGNKIPGPLILPEDSLTDLDEESDNNDAQNGQYGQYDKTCPLAHYIDESVIFILIIRDQLRYLQRSHVVRDRRGLL